MRTAWIVGVTAAHVAVVSGFMMQGCGTVRDPGLDNRVVPMPPRLEPVEPVAPVVRAPIVAPIVPDARVWEPAETTIYTIRKGESLSQIAHRYKLALADIVALNNIDDPNKVRAGQRLVLPGSVDLEKAPVQTVKKAEPMVVPPGGTEYVVQQGDCLSVIAKRFGVKTASLRSANKLKNDVIFVDQKLVIPAGGKPASAAPAAPVAPVIRDIAPLPPAIDEAPDMGEAPVIEAPVVETIEADDVLPPVVDMGASRIHKVSAGQSLLAIASEWNVSIDALRSANPWLNEKEPQEGDELVIPPPEA